MGVSPTPGRCLELVDDTEAVAVTRLIGFEVVRRDEPALPGPPNLIIRLAPGFVVVVGVLFARGCNPAPRPFGRPLLPMSGPGVAAAAVGADGASPWWSPAFVIVVAVVAVSKS